MQVKRSIRGTTSLAKRRKTTTCCAYTKVKPEWKELVAANNTVIAAGTPANPGALYINLLNAITQGVGPNQRIGNRIRVKKIEIAGSWGDDYPLPTYAALVNFKQQVGAPAANEQLGPFPLRDNCDTYQYAMKDNVLAQTYRFVKIFPGYGRVARFDRDAQTVVGDFNPQLMITNPNAVPTNNQLVYIRVTFSDI